MNDVISLLESENTIQNLVGLTFAPYVFEASPMRLQFSHVNAYTKGIA